MKKEKQITILDHIDDIKVPGNVFFEPANEYWALLCLKKGLDFLYRHVDRIDAATRDRINPTGNLKVFSHGNDPETVDVPKQLLTCSFHWYAISACQYVRTIGAIAYKQDDSRPKPLKYVQAVIPEVLAFRDKVAAHFAWSTKHSQDNDAERLASIMPPLTFIDDSWQVGAMQTGISQNGKVSTSAALKPWSISQIHLSLVKRYWPELLKKNDKVQKRT